MTVDPLPVDALLFDLGGVIVDIDPELIFARWAQHAGCDVPYVKARVRFDDMYERYERGEIALEEYFAYIQACLGRAMPHHHLLDGWNAIFLGTMPGIDDLLRAAAAHFPLFILSNTNPAHEEFWSRAYAAPLAHIGRVFVSSSMGLRKPDAACFHHVISEIGVPAARILFFDDLAANIAGAREVGLQAVHVKSIADVRRALMSLGVGL
jgi:HAD superfamily hydrolase (TIGR01509 family)